MRVAKWGNSLAVRLPKALVENLGLKGGDEVELSPLPGRRIGVEKIDRRERRVPAEPPSATAQPCKPFASNMADSAA